MSVNSATNASTQFKSFISESEVEESKRKRQEEWEKVRSAEQPLEAPEEEYDHRTLFDRLKEQKDKKDAEYDETHKLKNMIRGLDDDEVSFLDLVDKTKEDEENRRWKEERKEIQDYKKAVAELSEENTEQRKSVIKKVSTLVKSGNKKSQSALLTSVVRTKRKSSDSSTSAPNEKIAKVSESDNGAAKSSNISDGTTVTDKVTRCGVAECIGILPGLGEYDSESSDSAESSESDFDMPIQCDLLGRRKKFKACSD